MALVERKTFPCIQYGSISHISVIPPFVLLFLEGIGTEIQLIVYKNTHGNKWFFPAIEQLHNRRVGIIV